MRKQAIIAAAVAGTLLLGGCSERERREMREKEVRIAAEQARQQRILNQHIADLNAETLRQNNVLAAETARQRNYNLTALGKVIAFLSAIGGVIGFAVYSIRRLGERHLEERTKRHAQNLKAIEADPNLKPNDRKELYRAAVEAANQGGTPLLGYAGNEGGA
jgi:outer membrane murein-binding lipoprotein Lpp